MTINVVAAILSIVKNQKLLVLLVSLNIVVVFLLRTFSDSFLVSLLAMDLSIVALNFLGVATAHFYTKKFELYADIQKLPHTLPGLPSFGAEVGPRIEGIQIKSTFLDKKLDFTLQDVLYGPLAVGRHGNTHESGNASEERDADASLSSKEVFALT